MANVIKSFFPKIRIASRMIALALSSLYPSTIYRLKFPFKRYDRFAGKRGFRLTHVDFGGAPDFRPKASPLQL